MLGQGSFPSLPCWDRVLSLLCRVGTGFFPFSCRVGTGFFPFSAVLGQGSFPSLSYWDRVLFLLMLCWDRVLSLLCRVGTGFAPFSVVLGRFKPLFSCRVGARFPPFPCHVGKGSLLSRAVLVQVPSLPVPCRYRFPPFLARFPPFPAMFSPFPARFSPFSARFPPLHAKFPPFPSCVQIAICPNWTTAVVFSWLQITRLFSPILTVPNTALRLLLRSPRQQTGHTSSAATSLAS